jgi:hypothetical protein
MTVVLSSFAGAGWQFFDSNGDPLAGGKIYVYSAGTTTPATTYTSNLGTVQNTNPIILDAAGRLANEIWLTESLNFKFVLTDFSDVQIGTYDNVPGINSSIAALITDLANTSDATKGDALIGFKQSSAAGIFANAVAGTVHTKFQQYITGKDFGTIGNGVTDDTAFVQHTLDAINNYKGYDARIKYGTRISLYPSYSATGVIPFQNLTWPDYGVVRFDGPTYEQVTLLNNFSTAYQAIPVTSLAWTASTPYTLGTKVVNGGNAYQCIVAGTSASSGGPSGTGAYVADGTVVWKYIVNGYYGSIPVNETIIAAPYHPGLVIDVKTKASYNNVVQPAQQIALDLQAAGGFNSSEQGSINWRKDGAARWTIVYGAGAAETMDFHKYAPSTQLYRQHFSSDYGNLGIQQFRADYPLDVAGAARIITDFTSESPVQADNRSRYPGRPLLHFGYKTNVYDQAGFVGLGGANGATLTVTAPSSALTYSAVALTTFNTSGTPYSISVESVYPGLIPSVDNTFILGRGPQRWKEVYAANGTINTSDERLKTNIQPIDEVVLKAWAKVNFCQFKWKDAVQAKDGNARWHIGVIAQQVKEAFESEGLDAFDYGLLCYDEWEDQAAEPETAKPAIKAGDVYGIRYEQALALECAYLRSRLK